MYWIAAAAAGGLGALLRVGIITLCMRLPGPLPAGTLCANAAACTASGLIFGLQPEPALQLVLISGLVGGLGTMSSLCADSLNLLAARRLACLALYLCLQIALGLLCCRAGLWLAAVWS